MTGSGSKTLVYDANGSLTSDGTRTFEWDPLNRLTAVTSGAHRSELSYNGLSQRVKIVEKDNGTVTSTKNLVWVGAEICEERDASYAVTKRYYLQGVQIGTTNYYYTRDHLGSVRELTDSSGAVQTRYDYDPYGRRTKISGSLDADFGFTGHYFHQPDGLHLALYREYDADLGRWISRDPVAERAGPNMYSYVRNNPLNFTDRSGLQAETPTSTPGTTTSPTPTPAPSPPTLSAAGEAIFRALGYTVPGGELLDAAKLAPDIGKIFIKMRFIRDCEECRRKQSSCPSVDCPVCDDLAKLPW
jgi:RHS repeat-associated protein